MHGGVSYVSNSRTTVVLVTYIHNGLCLQYDFQPLLLHLSDQLARQLPRSWSMCPHGPSYIFKYVLRTATGLLCHFPTEQQNHCKIQLFPLCFLVCLSINMPTCLACTCAPQVAGCG
jgi:hypothetical protein